MLISIGLDQEMSFELKLNNQILLRKELLAFSKLQDSHFLVLFADITRVGKNTGSGIT
jgi:hypothetical protein